CPISYRSLSLMPSPPRSTLFPYTTLFRSLHFLGAGTFLLLQRRLQRFPRPGKASRHAGRARTRHVRGDLADHRSPDRTGDGGQGDRKSTRLNSSHVKISYAVFCLKKKTK